jgi:hypothetical protein
MAVGGKNDAHGDRHLQCFPDAGRHAPAYKIGAVAHRARLGVALAPSKSFRALPVAIAQALAAVWPVGVLVAIRITPQAKLERIELEGDRELVHRAFERIDGGRGTRGAHIAWCRKIEPRQLVPVFPMGALVEQAGPPGLLPIEVLVLRRHRNRFVHDCIECSAGVCRQLDLLDHRGPVAEHIHLLPGQHEAHRALQRARRQRGKHHIVLRRSPEPNPPPINGDMTRTSFGFISSTLQT